MKSLCSLVTHSDLTLYNFLFFTFCSVYRESCRDYNEPLNFWVSLQEFRWVLEKNSNVSHQPWSVRIGKNCAHCLKNRYPRPGVHCFPIWRIRSHLVNSIYDLKCPSRSCTFTVWMPATTYELLVIYELILLLYVCSLSSYTVKVQK